MPAPQPSLRCGREQHCRWQESWINTARTRGDDWRPSKRRRKTRRTKKRHVEMQLASHRVSAGTATTSTLQGARTAAASVAAAPFSLGAVGSTRKSKARQGLATFCVETKKNFRGFTFLGWMGQETRERETQLHEVILFILPLILPPPPLGP